MSIFSRFRLRTGGPLGFRWILMAAVLLAVVAAVPSYRSWKAQITTTCTCTKCQSPVLQDDFSSQSVTASLWNMTTSYWSSENGGVMVLNPPQDSVNASFGPKTNPIATSKNWRVEYSVKISDPDWNGYADGVAFMFQRGASGTRYYAVELDTYYNSNHGFTDYAAPHIALNYGTTGGESFIGNHVSHASASGITNGSFHSVRIDFDNGRTAVYLDGTKKIDTTIANAAAQGILWYGYTGATHQKAVIDNVKVWDFDCPAPAPQCSDGIDNDMDGAIDYPADFSCSSPTDNDETNPKAQCQDGIDNDSDTAFDMHDPGCDSRQDNDEKHICPTPTPAYFCPCASDADCTAPDTCQSMGQSGNHWHTYCKTDTFPCQDGVDNDGDGLIDWPNDPGCIAAFDIDEHNTCFPAKAVPDSCLMTFNCPARETCQSGYCRCGCATTADCTAPDTCQSGYCRTSEPRCGDGWRTVDEQCDNGAQNGQACTPAYGSSCTYCSTACTTVTLQGASCGDGIKQTNEECESNSHCSLGQICVNCTCAASLPTTMDRSAWEALATEEEAKGNTVFATHVRRALEWLCSRRSAAPLSVTHDGRRLTYRGPGMPGEEDVYHVYLLDADTRSARVLYAGAHSGVQITWPTISSDGSHVLLRVFGSAGRYIYTQPAPQGTVLRIDTTTDETISMGSGNYWPFPGTAAATEMQELDTMISRNGERITFVGMRTFQVLSNDGTGTPLVPGGPLYKTMYDFSLYASQAGTPSGTIVSIRADAPTPNVPNMTPITAVRFEDPAGRFVSFVAPQKVGTGNTWPKGDARYVYLRDTQRNILHTIVQLQPGLDPSSYSYQIAIRQDMLLRNFQPQIDAKIADILAGEGSSVCTGACDGEKMLTFCGSTAVTSSVSSAGIAASSASSVSTAAISLTGSVETPESVPVGGTIVYRVTVRNNGSTTLSSINLSVESAAMNTFEGALSDVICTGRAHQQSGADCAIPPLAAGQQHIVNVGFRVGNLSCSAVINAHISASNADPHAFWGSPLTLTPVYCTSTDCGNGVKETGEQCDDGNTAAGDGCSATCAIETGGQCFDVPVFRFDASKVVFANHETTRVNVAKLDDQKAIVVYRHHTADYKAARVATIQNGQVSFGPEAIFDSSWDNPAIDIDVQKIDANRALLSYVMYTNPPNSPKCRSVVAQISGNSVTFGTPVDLVPMTADSGCSRPNAAVLSPTQAVIGRQKSNLTTMTTGFVTSIATIAGTQITLSASQNLSTNETYYRLASLDATRIMAFGYFNPSSSTDPLRVRVGTVAGSAITWGTEVTLRGAMYLKSIVPLGAGRALLMAYSSAEQGMVPIEVRFNGTTVISVRRHRTIASSNQPTTVSGQSKMLGSETFALVRGVCPGNQCQGEFQGVAAPFDGIIPVRHTIFQQPDIFTGDSSLYGLSFAYMSPNVGVLAAYTARARSGPTITQEIGTAALGTPAGVISACVPASTCGNGTVEGFEDCDTGHACQTGYSCLACQCMLTMTVASSASSGGATVCGNGAKETGEQCDIAPRQYATGTTPVAVETADFNHDGKLDLIATNMSQNGSFSVLLGNGDGTFQSAQTTLMNASCGRANVADFDGDTFPDVLTVCGTNPNVRMFKGNGNGTFQPALSTVIPYVTKLTVGDLNRDGDPDVVTAGGGAVTVYVGGTGFTFQQSTTVSMNCGHSAVVVADFDKDGNPDVACDWSDLSGTTIHYFFGNGQGGLSAPISFKISWGGNLSRVYPADLDNDGDQDLLLIYNGQGFESVLSNPGRTFTEVVNTNPENFPYAHALADVDGDSFVDLVGNETNGALGAPTLVVRKGLGNGGFSNQALSTITFLNDLGYGLAVADLDGNGAKDFVVVHGAAGGFTGNFADKISVAVNHCMIGATCTASCQCSGGVVSSSASSSLSLAYSVSSASACTAEGQIGIVGEAPPCCAGLEPMPNRIQPAGVCFTQTGEPEFICLQCGNGACGLGENSCNCPQDCGGFTSSLSSYGSSQQGISSAAAALCPNGVLDAGETCEIGVCCGAGYICDRSCRCVPAGSSSSAFIASSSSAIIQASSSSASFALSSASSFPTSFASTSASSAVSAMCGNGNLEGAEECEIGHPCANGGACINCACSTVGFCGDGNVDPLRDEECEQNADCPSGYVCSLQCQCQQTNAVCGDGNLEGGEQCEHGHACANAGQICNNCLCSSPPRCGNAQVEYLEECEIGTPCSNGQICVNCICRAPAACGNAVLESGEQCENDTHCLTGQRCDRDTCQCEGTARDYCGDAALNQGEECEVNAPCTDADKNCDLDTCRCVKQPVILACGDGTVDPGEDCDIGIACPAGMYCAFPQCHCVGTQPRCGNGKLEGSERCEIGAGCALPGEVCDLATCQCAPSDPEGRCGNGLLTAGEECEVGMPCPFGWACDFPRCMCLNQPVCGNGVLDPGEQCETNVLCTGNQQTCDFSRCRCTGRIYECGNGVRDPGEECDDGNTRNDDGCSKNCKREMLYSVVGGGSLCGNGIIEFPEDCDDGNIFPGDGCSAFCYLEEGFVASGFGTSGFGTSALDPSASAGAGQQYPAAGDSLASAAAFSSVAPDGTRGGQWSSLRPGGALPAMTITFPQVFGGQPPSASLPAAMVVPYSYGMPTAPMTRTGPEAVVLVSAGAAMGWAWIRRRKQRS